MVGACWQDAAGATADDAACWPACPGWQVSTYSLDIFMRTQPCKLQANSYAGYRTSTCMCPSTERSRLTLPCQCPAEVPARYQPMSPQQHTNAPFRLPAPLHVALILCDHHQWLLMLCPADPGPCHLLPGPPCFRPPPQPAAAPLLPSHLHPPPRPHAAGAHRQPQQPPAAAAQAAGAYAAGAWGYPAHVPQL